MDKYDRDPWHDAETLPGWFIVLVTIIMLMVILIGGCDEQQLEQIDPIVRDANDIVTAIGELLESPPARAFLPPDIQVYGAVGIALASIAVNGWQKVRGTLMKKTTKAIVRGIEVADKPNQIQ